MSYQYKKKSFASQMAIYHYLTTSEVINCSYGFFNKVLKDNDQDVKLTLKAIKKLYKGSAKERQGFEIGGEYFNTMSAFEDRYNLPKNIVSTIKSKYKVSVKKAALKALDSPLAKHQILQEHSMVSKFFQLKLPTTNFGSC